MVAAGVAGLRVVVVVVVVDTLKQGVGTREVDIRSARFDRHHSVSQELVSSHTPRISREWVGAAAKFMVPTSFTQGTQRFCMPTQQAKTGFRVLKASLVTLGREPKWRAHTALVS